MLEIDLEPAYSQPLIYEICSCCLEEMDWNFNQLQFECLICDTTFSIFSYDIDSEDLEVTYG